MPLVMVWPSCTLVAYRMVAGSQTSSRRASVSVKSEAVWIVVRTLWIQMTVLTALILRMREDEASRVFPVVGSVEVEGGDVLMHRPLVQAYRMENLEMVVVKSSLRISVERLSRLGEQVC